LLPKPLVSLPAVSPGVKNTPVLPELLSEEQNAYESKLIAK
jgi:hypothetical protein